MAEMVNAVGSLLRRLFPSWFTESRFPSRVSIAGDRVAVCGGDLEGRCHYFDSIDWSARCPTCGSEGALVAPMLERKAGRRPLRLVSSAENRRPPVQPSGQKGIL